MVWERALERYHLLEPGDRILVGVSGGPDSMALLDIVKQAAERYGCFLAVVHVNHCLRGEQADKEADFVRTWCHRQQIPCVVFVRNVALFAKEQGLSTEAAAHEVRFAAFREAAEQFQANKLALGHHQDDRAETVLLHLIQGTGLDGLAALPPQDDWIIRPLIEATKADLLAYCQQEQLPYFLDATNDEMIYLRNRIRHRLLPELVEDYNPQMRQALVRLAITASEDSLFLAEQAQKAWQSCAVCQNDTVMLDLTRWRLLPPALQKRVLRLGYLALQPQAQGLSYQQTEALLRLASEKQGQKQLDLPKRVQAVKSYDTLILKRQTDNLSPTRYELAWQLPEILVLPDGSRLMAKWLDVPLTYKDDFYQVLLDGERLTGMLTVRNRRPGDKLQPLGMQGKKKLKAYFIDKKVPQADRDRWPLVFNGDELIWLPGLTIAEGYQATSKTQKYCQLTFVSAKEGGFLQEGS